MARVAFTDNIQRHVTCPDLDVSGSTVRDVLDRYFTGNERARRYVLDDQGQVRKHMAVFVDGIQVRDRQGLRDPVGPASEVFVVQALSGG